MQGEKEKTGGILERILDEELIKQILADYRAKPDGMRFEQEYDAGKAMLIEQTSPEQLALLEKFEALAEENLWDALRIGFSAGVYTGFRQVGAPEISFDRLIVKKLLSNPDMERCYPLFSARSKEMVRLFQTLKDELPEQKREELLAVETGWDERVYGVLYHVFHLGISFAIEIMARVEV